MTIKYVVAYDGSTAGRRAVDHALRLAGGDGSEVLVAHVLEWSAYSILTQEELAERHKRRNDELERARTDVIEPLLADLQGQEQPVQSVIKYGNVADTIIEIARSHDATQIICGRMGEEGLASRLFGSVASKLAQSSPIPVTIVP